MYTKWKGIKMVGAIVGSAALGAVSSSKAAKSSSKSANKASDSADRASQLQYEASMEQLDFQKKQYEDWENIFGPIQDNLSNYYKHMSPDSIATLGIQNIEQSYTQSRQNLDTQLAKRGITNSGATVAGLTQLESSRMLGKAEVRTNAPQQVANQQLGFLSAGLGLQPSLQQGVSGAMSNQMNMFGQQATNQQGMANQYSNQAAQAYSGIGSSIGQGINSYMTYNALNQPQVLNSRTGGMGIYGLDYK